MDKKWIDTILKNPQKYNTDSLKKVLDKSCPVYSDNAPASRSQPTDNPNTKMRRDILRDF